MTFDPITLADEAEERSAADALRAATTDGQLAEAWFVNVEPHFPERSPANKRLYALYLELLVKFAPGARAG